jgi:predicted P-loop ATPase/GTPase
MKYCPECGAEYEPRTSTCNECQVALVDTPPATDAEDEIAIVFRSGDGQAADRVCNVILHEVDAVLHSQSSRAFPTPATAAGEVLVSVAARRAARARQLLHEALEDGALAEEDGEVVEE